MQRRLLALLLLPALALAPAACKPRLERALNVVVIGDQPKLRDPALGPLAAPDRVLVGSVGQGLVRFDGAGNIVGGLAERWNVSDDGMSYIFRIATTKWPDGRPVTAQQVARLLNREIGARSKNGFKDALGAVSDIVAMTDRVIQIELKAPRPDLLSILAQPELAILRNGQGTGPFAVAPNSQAAPIKLVRDVAAPDEDAPTKEQVLLSGAAADQAVQAFVAGKADLVLGGTFADLAVAQRSRLPGGSLRFDPASGLFGLVAAQAGGPLDKPEVRRLLSEAINRDAFVAALGVPNLAPRVTLLEPGLDGVPAPVAPPWTATPVQNRRAEQIARAGKLLGKQKPAIRVGLPEGPGGDLLFQTLVRDWGILGLTVQRVTGDQPADFRLLDMVAPSTSPAWFVRRFRCEFTAVCDPEADALMDAAREAPVADQRYALIEQAAAKVDDDQLFIPLAAPVRWSLVSGQVPGFAGNRFAIHTLTDLKQRPSNGD